MMEIDEAVKNMLLGKLEKFKVSRKISKFFVKEKKLRKFNLLKGK